MNDAFATLSDALTEAIQRSKKTPFNEQACNSEKEGYDFSHARRNPYLKHLKSNGFHHKDERA